MRALILPLVFSLVVWPVQAKAQEDDVLVLIDEALTLFQQAKYNEAIPLAEEALKLTEKKIPPEDSLLVVSLLLLANVYGAVSRLDEAELINKRALGIAESAFGTDNYSASIALNIPVVSFFAASDGTAQCDTSNVLLPA